MPFALNRSRLGLRDPFGSEAVCQTPTTCSPWDEVREHKIRDPVAGKCRLLRNVPAIPQHVQKKPEKPILWASI